MSATEAALAAAYQVAAYRSQLGAELKRLRKRRRFARYRVASAIGVTDGLLARYEAGKAVPEARRLQRLADHYDVDFLTLLACVVDHVRPRGLTTLDPTAESLLLLLGITPEEAIHGFHHIGTPHDASPPGGRGSARTVALPEPAASGVGAHVHGELVPATGPLGELVRYTRIGSPIRRAGALRLRQEYEAGATIGGLSEFHGISFGLARTLLREANTPMHHGGPRTASSR